MALTNACTAALKSYAAAARVEAALQAMSAAENFPSRVLLSNEEQSEEAGVAAGAQGLGEAANVPPGGASASAYNILPRTLFSMLRRLELQSLLPHAALDRDRLRPLGWHPRGCRVAGGPCQLLAASAFCADTAWS